MVNHQMGVFMHRHWIVFAADILHHDVVAPTGAAIVGNRKIVDAVGLVLLFPAKSDDADGELRKALRSTGFHEKTADLLEIQDRFAAFFLTRSRVELEV